MQSALHTQNVCVHNASAPTGHQLYLGPGFLGLRCSDPCVCICTPAHMCACILGHRCTPALTCPQASWHTRIPPWVHQTCLHISVSCAHSHWEPHVGSGLFWEAGQVNRCWEMPPSPAGSPGFHNDFPPLPIPPPGPASKDTPSHPPSVLVSLDADRAHGGVWRILTRSQELHQPPPPPRVAPSVYPTLSCLCFPTFWAAAPAPHSPPSWIHDGERASFRNHHKGSPKPCPLTLGSPSSTKTSAFPSGKWEGGQTRNLPRFCPSLAVRFSQRPGEGR